MKSDIQFMPPRQLVIYSHTRKMLDETALSVTKFAMQVAENYFKMTAIDCRSVPFKSGVTIDELCKAEKLNAQLIGRYMDRTVKTLPCDLEDAWVTAMLPAYRHECERDLSARRGMLSIEFPEFKGGSDVASVATMVKSFGDVLQALVPVLADGVITEADAPHARKVMRETDDLVAQLMGVRSVLLDVLLQSQLSKAMQKGLRL